MLSYTLLLLVAATSCIITCVDAQFGLQAISRGGAKNEQLGKDTLGTIENEAIEEAVTDFLDPEKDGGAAMLNRMFPLISQLFKRRHLGLSFGQVFKDVTDLVDEKEIAIFATIGWGIVPATQAVYELVANVTGRGILDENSGGEDDNTEDTDKEEETTMSKVLGGLFMKGKEVAVVPKHKMKSFRSTMMYQIVDHISQASKIGFSVIMVDCLALTARMVGYNPFNIIEKVSRLFSKVAYTGWFVLRLQLLKRYLLGKYVSTSEGTDLGKWNAFDKFGDGVFYVIWFLNVLSYFEVETGIAVKGLFSVGATGTLILGLASKDIATQLMSGLMLNLSDKMFEGDTIQLPNGKVGEVDHMGWFETMIRGSDELVVGIPNTELSSQRIYNLSRTPRSQVKQELLVSYNDVAKIPKLLDSIKEEIKNDCPKLITDGSRPFRANWRNYEKDHLEVVVDCHFMIKPTGSEYWDNRQTVLEAIDRAARKTDVSIGGKSRGK